MQIEVACKVDALCFCLSNKKNLIFLFSTFTAFLCPFLAKPILLYLFWL